MGLQSNRKTYYTVISGKKAQIYSRATASDTCISKYNTKII
jgi:hypothetical protein